MIKKNFIEKFNFKFQKIKKELKIPYEIYYKKNLTKKKYFLTKEKKTSINYNKIENLKEILKNEKEKNNLEMNQITFLSFIEKLKNDKKLNEDKMKIHKIFEIINYVEDLFCIKANKYVLYEILDEILKDIYSKNFYLFYEVKKKIGKNNLF
jgi:hypothetical protein